MKYAAYAAVGARGQGEPLESPRDLGKGRLPGLNVGDLSQDAQQWGEEPEETTSSS